MVATRKEDGNIKGICRERKYMKSLVLKDLGLLEGWCFGDESAE
jgi:hypothetical protein